MFLSDKRKKLLCDKIVMKSESVEIAKEVKKSDGW